MKTAIKVIISFVLALVGMVLFGGAIVGVASGLIWVGDQAFAKPVLWMLSGIGVLIVALIAAYQLFEATITIYKRLFGKENTK